jgi:hypothetical protein
MAFIAGVALSALAAHWALRANRRDEHSVEREEVYVRDSGLLAALLITNGLIAAVLATLWLR